MTVGNLGILVRFSQGEVFFDSFFTLLRLLPSARRRELLLEIVELTIALEIKQGDQEICMALNKEFEGSNPFYIIKSGVTREKLLELISVEGQDLKVSFKMLLDIFSLCYDRKFAIYKNDPDKFWFWDYSNFVEHAQIN
jgi:hypothetical protein